ncbi:MAG: response regulator [Xanthomonadales bacterium]|nr:response regulator [Xanthomonadales bacterium]NIX13054.1 response regulator [Xanthomonadales bacterium]
MKDQANILIVDDEEVVCLSYFRSLAKADYQAKVARGGNEALRIMEQRPFDVVFLDLRMPDLDGIEVLKTIRQKWPECEVVIITGYPTIQTAKEAVRLGAYHYLVKPVSPEDVVKAARNAMTHKSWALRKDWPAMNSMYDLENRAWIDENPFQTARHGGKS